MFVLKYVVQVFKEAVKLVTTDKGFGLGTDSAQKAQLTAHRLLLFMEASCHIFLYKVIERYPSMLLLFQRCNLKDFFVYIAF